VSTCKKGAVLFRAAKAAEEDKGFVEAVFEHRTEGEGMRICRRREQSKLALLVSKPS